MNWGRGRRLQFRNTFLKYKHMIRRLIRQLVHQRLKAYPAVALVGARQCGNTTLARDIGGAYFDLDPPIASPFLEPPQSPAYSS